MGKYTTIQVKRELYKELHDYCCENGYSKSGLIEKIDKTKNKWQPKDQVMYLKSILILYVRESFFFFDCHQVIYYISHRIYV